MPIPTVQPSSAIPEQGLVFASTNKMHVYFFMPGRGNWHIQPVGPKGEQGVVPKLITLEVRPGLMGQVTPPPDVTDPERIYAPAVADYIRQGHVFINPKDKRTTVLPEHRGQKDGQTYPYALVYNGTKDNVQVKSYTHACAQMVTTADNKVRLEEVPWQFNRWAQSLVERGVIEGPSAEELDSLLNATKEAYARAKARSMKLPEDARSAVTGQSETNMNNAIAAVEAAQKGATSRRRALPEPATATA